ncbi:conserved hypothetical protein [Mesorhizobium sp. ORS 3324]|nr:conserved hypothetical protein [Mesorhizobium sp. ORS 3324]
MPFNQYGFEQVEYSGHYDQFAVPFLIEGNAENNLYFTHEAQQNHIYSVNNAVLELLTDALGLLSTVAFAKKAEDIFRYGVMRRLRMLNASFKSFQNAIPPNRTTPLSQEHSDRVCRDLNAIYIDILGMLDNYAWTMVFQAGSAQTRAARPLAINLFKPPFASDRALQPAADILQGFKAWEEDVKTRRNPAAHRMPLYVPPAALTPSDVAEYECLERLISGALHAQDFEKMKGLRKTQRRIGSLIPKFLHVPEGPVTDIYPVIPEDIGQVVKIGRIVQTFLRTHGPLLAPL